jgi:hypothetical protein
VSEESVSYHSTLRMNGMHLFVTAIANLSSERYASVVNHKGRLDVPWA